MTDETTNSAPETSETQSADATSSTDTETKETQGASDAGDFVQTGDKADTDAGKPAKETDADDDFVKVEKAEDAEKSDDEGEADADAEVPEAYERPEMPEGVTFDEKAFEALGPTFKEIGLSQAQVNKLVGKFGEHVAAQSAEAQAETDRQFAEVQAGFKSELKEYFGDDYSTKSAAVSRLFRQYDPQAEVAGHLGEMGLLNFPPLMKMLASVGEVLSEGGHMESASPSNKAKGPVQPHQVLYGSKQ